MLMLAFGILLAASGGDPGVTKASQLAKGDPAYTLAMMIGLQGPYCRNHSLCGNHHPCGGGCQFGLATFLECVR